MKYLNQEIENELKNQGAELIRFVGISHLDEKQNRQLPTAIVFALPLTAEYAKMVFNIPDYVQARIADNYNFDDCWRHRLMTVDYARQKYSNIENDPETSRPVESSSDLKEHSECCLIQFERCS